MYTTSMLSIQDDSSTVYMGALVGGSSMSHSNLRNGNVPCRYFYNIHVDFNIVYCRMSNLRNGLCHVTNIISHVVRLHVAYRF